MTPGLSDDDRSRDEHEGREGQQPEHDETSLAAMPELQVGEVDVLPFGDRVGEVEPRLADRHLGLAFDRGPRRRPSTEERAWERVLGMDTRRSTRGGRQGLVERRL